MTRRLISTGSPFERDLSYSRAVVQGDWCFLSGVTGYDYARMEMADGVAAQVAQSFLTVRQVLSDAGFQPQDIVRVVHYLPRRDLVAEATPAIGQALADIRPAATMVIADLMQDAMLYEVEVTAYRGTA